MNDVTLVLQAIDQGDSQAAEQLLPLVYKELRILAAQRMAQESPDHTLQATALVHEAYLRLVDGQRAQPWNSRGHFFAAAAEAMRRILVDAARRKQRRKEFYAEKGAEIEASVKPPDPREDLLALDEALSKLKAVDNLAAQLVQLRYFAGLTQADAADVLDIPRRSADRTWAYAKTWLRRELQKPLK